MRRRGIEHLFERNGRYGEVEERAPARDYALQLAFERDGADGDSVP